MKKAEDRPDMDAAQTQCKRCGTCCTKGGPALHNEDLPLIRTGIIPLERLITIRKGELVYKPECETPMPARCELVKISGVGNSWQCYYFDSAGKGCQIYLDRPVSCGALQCWDTAAVEALVEKNTITRLDIVEKTDPIHALILEHEKLCPIPDMLGLSGSGGPMELLEDLVNEDLRLRTEAVRRFRLSLPLELFYFGRPVFQGLEQIGLNFMEEAGRLKLILG